MPTLTWLIEDIEPENLFYEHLKHKGKDVVLCSKIWSYDLSRYDEVVKSKPDNEFIFRWSLRTLNQLKENPVFNIWQDGLFDVSCFTTILKDLCINPGFIGAELKDLLEPGTSDKIAEMFGDRVFIRPDTSEKAFDGQLVSTHLIKDFVRDVESSGASLDEPITLAPEKVISREWRVVVGPEGPIAYGQYRRDGSLHCSSGGPAQVTSLADRVHRHLSQYFQYDQNFPPFYVVDICDSAGLFYVLEMGSFNFCGLYLMDYDVISLKVEEHILSQKGKTLNG